MATAANACTANSPPPLLWASAVNLLLVIPTRIAVLDAFCRREPATAANGAAAAATAAACVESCDQLQPRVPAVSQLTPSNQNFVLMRALGARCFFLVSSSLQRSCRCSLCLGARIDLVAEGNGTRLPFTRRTGLNSSGTDSH